MVKWLVFWRAGWSFAAANLQAAFDKKNISKFILENLLE